MERQSATRRDSRQAAVAEGAADQSVRNPTISRTVFIVTSASAPARLPPSLQHTVDIDRVGRDAAHLAGDRRELVDRQIGERRLELGELAAAEIGQHRLAAGLGERGIEHHQVFGLRPVLQPLDFGRQCRRVGLGLADLPGDGVGIVGQIDARQVGGIRFRHLLQAVAQRHDARRRALDQRLGEREEAVDGLLADLHLDADPEIGDARRKVVVEFLGDVARQLQVLLLVVADRHMGGAVGEDVGRHQRRIGEQADRGVLAVLAGLLLELRHAREPAHAGDAVEDPGKLGVLDDPALVEDDVALRVDAGRQERRRHLARRLDELDGILPGGDGVLVDDAIDAVVAGLQLRKAADGAEIVAEMQIAGRLDARKDERFEGGH